LKPLLTKRLRRAHLHHSYSIDLAVFLDTLPRYGFKAGISDKADFPVLPVIRLPCSANFATGRGGFLQLLSMTLSPCCPYQPRRSVAPLQFVRRSMLPLLVKWRLGLRSISFRGHTGSLALRPGDALTILMRWLCQWASGFSAVGIEIRRANFRWEVTSLALSIARWVHSSTMATVGMDASCRWRVTSPALSVAGWVHSSTMATVGMELGRASCRWRGRL
jgi:hypothetical protein